MFTSLEGKANKDNFFSQMKETQGATALMLGERHSLGTHLTNVQIYISVLDFGRRQLD